MPKISKRRSNLQQYEASTVRQRASMTPRKVSFEDSSPMSSTNNLNSSLSSASSGSLPRTTCSQDLKPKAMLRRHTTSICLAQMAEQAIDEEGKTSCREESISPVSVIHRDEHASSLWGHFVDVIPDDDESSNSSQSRCSSQGDSPFYFTKYTKNSFEPYYKPKRMQFRTRKSSFLPGFILSIPTETDHPLEEALKRMQV